VLCRQGGEHLGALAAHAHEPNGRLRVPVGDGLEEGADGVGLGVEPRRLVVSVSGVLAVVHDNHDGLENHLGRVCCWGRPAALVGDVGCAGFFGQGGWSGGTDVVSDT
jgi:hypothetical protein